MRTWSHQKQIRLVAFAVAVTVAFPLFAQSDSVPPTGLKLDTPSVKVIGVWQLHDHKKTMRVTLFADGTTNHKWGWKPISRTMMNISTGSATLSHNGWALGGRWTNQDVFDGRLLQSNMWLAGTTESVPAPEVNSNLAASDKVFQENLQGLWQLSGRNSRKKKELSIPVKLTSDYRITDADRTLAVWSTKNRRLTIQFLDPQVGPATLSPKSVNEFNGRAQSKVGGQWSLQLQKIVPVSTWETDELGRIVLYSNGRVSDPMGRAGHGCWRQDGRNFNFSRFRVQVSADGRSFKSPQINGTLIPN